MGNKDALCINASVMYRYNIEIFSPPLFFSGRDRLRFSGDFSSSNMLLFASQI